MTDEQKIFDFVKAYKDRIFELQSDFFARVRLTPPTPEQEEHLRKLQTQQYDPSVVIGGPDKYPPTPQPKRHGHPKFYHLLDRMADIHSQKNYDYSDSTDPFHNFRAAEALGIPAWKGALVRLGDKFMRVTGFARRGELKVKDESVEDTLLDLAIYSLITLILYQESKDKCQSTTQSEKSTLPESGSTTYLKNPVAAGSQASATTSESAGEKKRLPIWPFNLL